MIALAIIGFASICGFACAVTIWFALAWSIEAGFTGKPGPGTAVSGCLAFCLWVAVFWLNPFTVTLGAAA